ncbi:MAG: radical SAM protein [Verrucomicrobia bacterium]|nr:MAG: radical SAM protein [Verrucomicrobiota bacterium]
MRILLIMPDAHMHTLRIGPFVRSFREAPLTLTILAALVPPSLEAEIHIIDGNTDTIPENPQADLIGISVITGCARPAYALADYYRARGIPVVLGGVHVTVLPGEALKHADSIVIGRGEHAWPELLGDFRRGRMQKVYREKPIRDHLLADVPPPRRDLQRKSAYMVPNTVQATRGCRHRCDFCMANAVWPRYLKRPVAEVVDEIRKIRSRNFAFNDVSLVEDIEFSKELFSAIAPLKKQWGALVTAEVLEDTSMLDLMAESGCVYLLVGFESGSQTVLRGISKSFNKALRYRDLIRSAQERGISIQGCFVFGFDHDGPDVFESTTELVQDLGIDIPRYSLYTPYPGTRLFARMQAEGRILSYNWDDYDTMHVVINPARMSPEELYCGFKWAYRRSFRMRNIVKRLRRADIRCAINFVGNLAYRNFIRRLDSDPIFARPFSTDDVGSPPAPGDWHLPGEERALSCLG